MKKVNRFVRFLAVAALAAATVVAAPGPAQAQSSDTLTVGIIKDINPGSSGSSTDEAILYNGVILFEGYVDSIGRELFVSDGTEEGTRLLKDIWPGSGSSIPRSFVEYGGLVYFSANDSTHGSELWSTDGTTMGTQLVADLDPGTPDSGPESFELVRDRLVFHANTTAEGSEWFYTDGSTTAIIADINPGQYGSVSGTDPERANNGTQMFFEGSDGEHGAELWVTDGYSAHLVDIYPGGGSSRPGEFCAVDSGAVFVATPYYRDAELYFSDGTETNTHPLTDRNFKDGPDEVTVVNGHIIFVAEDLSYNGMDLWAYNPDVSTNARSIKNIDDTDYDSGIYEFVVFGDRAFFRADDLVHGRELWVTDGTGEGTHLVHDVDPDYDSDPTPLALWNGRMVFVADHDAYGEEFWITNTDYTSAEMIADFSPGSDSGARDDWAMLFNGRLFVEAMNAEVGSELAVIEMEQAPLPFDLAAPANDAAFTEQDGFVVDFRWHPSEDPNAGQQPDRYLLELVVTPPSGSDTTVVVTAPDTSHNVNLPDSLGINGFSGTIGVNWTVRAVSGTDTADASGMRHLTLDGGQTSGIGDEATALPEQFAVREVYPNPFNPRVTVALDVPRAADVRAVIYNVLGRKVATLAQGRMAAGAHRLTWRPDGLTSGIYFLHVTSGADFREVRRLVFMK